MTNGLLADAMIVTHLAYLVYLVAGGFLAWRWPRAIYPHMVAAVWALGIVTIGYPCPLTTLEGHFRGEAGVPGFIDRYVEGVVYPEEHTLTARLVVAAVVAVSYLGAFRRRRRSTVAAG